MTLPTGLQIDSVAAFVIDKDGLGVPAVARSSLFRATPPPQSSTLSLHDALPISMSAWVIVWLAVQFSVAPGANDEPLAGTQTRSLTCESVTVTAANVVLPVFLATVG